MINLLLFLGPEGLKWNTTAITVLDETSLSALGVPSSILIEFRTQILYAVDVGDKREYPSGLQLDQYGNLYVSDTFNNHVLKLRKYIESE
ncbi:unnamed protein product [Adineta ricciae]|uniref:Uncharacterized protein n=1 Tax=Adineta ricciae TaxID=249248 RepID=A0A814ISZ6_ADIRI|nr:unnamed protein product [Adineta ricciae]